MQVKVYTENISTIQKEKDVEQGDSEKIDLKLQTFQEFQRSGRCGWLIVTFNCLFSGLYCPYYFVEQYYLRNPSRTYLPLRVLQAVWLSVAIVCGWLVVLLHTKTSSLLQWRYRIRSAFVLSISLFFSFNSFSHLYRYSDHSFNDGFQFGADDRNDHQVQRQDLVYSSLILLLLIPVSAVTIFRETNQYTIFFVWLIISLTYFLVAIHHADLTSVLLVVVFLFMSILVILDRYSFEWSVFEYNSKLELQIEKYTMERRATEMRDMIGNVAHDLKTPLTSFMTATELISTDIEDFKSNMNSLLSMNMNTTSTETLIKSKYYECFQGFQDSIQGSIDSIRDIHAFMLMVINRCLDYRKASIGINLTPSQDTVDLDAAIRLPVQCMLNIQQKIGITVKNTLPETIRWITTDRQWLQENLLCLLSNAVKHSVSGEVELIISLQSFTEKKKIPGQIIDEIRVLPESSISRMGERSYASSSHTGSTDPKSKQFHSRSVIRKGLRGLLSTSKSITDHTNYLYKEDMIVPEHIQPLGDINEVGLKSPTNHQENMVLLFEIIDCSSGLSSLEMMKFFNPFKQKRLSGGTGLGLYSLAKRVEALGGHYGIHNRDDGKLGSVVWFSIPYHCSDYRPLLTNRLRKVDLLVEKAKSKSSFGSSQKSEKGMMMTMINESKLSTKDSKEDEEEVVVEKPQNPYVLIVEDAPTIAKMTQRMLAKQQIDTDIAENGKIAVEKVINSYSSLTTRKYTAILMDFQMPEMDGIEATSRIREYELQQNINTPLCIIGISAMSDTLLIEEGKRKGMTTFIPKPFTQKDFLSFLHQVSQF